MRELPPRLVTFAITTIIAAICLPIYTHIKHLKQSVWMDFILIIASGLVMVTDQWICDAVFEWIRNRQSNK